LVAEPDALDSAGDPHVRSDRHSGEQKCPVSAVSAGTSPVTGSDLAGGAEVGGAAGDPDLHDVVPAAAAPLAVALPHLEVVLAVVLDGVARVRRFLRGDTGR